MKKYFEIKEPDVSWEEIANLEPAMLFLLGYVAEYADQNNLKVVLTSITEKVDGRVSSTHSDGRGLDFSLIGWNDLHIERLTHKINSTYKKWGTSRTGENPKVLIVHDVGKGNHGHLQCRRGLKIGVLNG